MKKITPESAGRGCTRFFVDAFFAALVLWVLIENGAPSWAVWATVFIYAKVAAARELVLGAMDRQASVDTARIVATTVSALSTLGRLKEGPVKFQDGGPVR